MQRIDLMSKEEIIKLLNRRNRGFEACRNCPAETSCGESSCTEAIFDHLFEDVEMVQRASIFTPEEAVRDFILSRPKTQFNNIDYNIDLLDLARFLMEKVPKPLDK